MPCQPSLVIEIGLLCRGYGGDGHTSMQFALQNFQVLPWLYDLCSSVPNATSLNNCSQAGAFFNKWTRDFADVQEPSGGSQPTALTACLLHGHMRHVSFSPQDMYPTLHPPSAAGGGRRGAVLLLLIHGKRTQPALKNFFAF